MRYCTCKKWTRSLTQIVEAQVFCARQSAGLKYTGDQMEYCPWCGGKLFYRKDPKSIYRRLWFQGWLQANNIYPYKNI
jgi:hypothetical protein